MIVYAPGALRDLRSIARWYRAHRPSYEARFFERLRGTLHSVEESPLTFPVVLEDVTLRRARVLRTPYSVAFLVFEGVPHIVAVMHGAQDPQTTTRRARDRFPRGRGQLR